MGKDKLRKFKEVEGFDNCVALGHEIAFADSFPLKGKWRKEHFKNDNPIVLELGCGKGEYTVGLAKRYPNKNFIGVDIKGNRIWKGAKEATETKMNNVAFIRTRINFIDACFVADEVDEIWITFPDPQPEKPRTRKRLTNMNFINKYKKILKDGAPIHLKTDSRFFYDYTLGVIKENNFKLVDSTTDLYADAKERDEALTSIQTFYEKKFSEQGFKINYLKFIP